MINESCIVFQEVDVNLTQMLATKEKFMASVLGNRAKHTAFIFKSHLAAGNQRPDLSGLN